MAAVAAVLFLAITGLHATSGDSGGATLVLFVVPIAACAIRFGLSGGLAAALVALALLLGWDIGGGQNDLGGVGIAALVTMYLLVGGLLGRLVEERHGLEAKLNRHYALSHDLICIAGFDGYFEEVNPAWEKTLGFTSAELRSRPFIELVHPDDREHTATEAAKLADQDTDTISFRNRYSTADGGYRWLEWSARSVSEERRIYATARDVTIQKQAEDVLQDQAQRLERRVRKRTRELEETRLEALKRLSVVAEYRDDETHEHTERVGRAAALIGRELGLSKRGLAVLRRAAPLHDIGKVGIPDAILLKPGKLTPAEYAVMREHVEIGARILADGRFAILRLAGAIVISHHERWEGTGYPRRLRGEEIPLAGRIVAVADVFDALTHDRPYKRAWPIADAVAEIEGGAGKHFDPRVVAAFVALDHARLLASIAAYDLDLPAPPLTASHKDSARLGAGPARRQRDAPA